MNLSEIFSKGWFKVVFFGIGAILVFIGFVWVTGNKADEIIEYIFVAGFFFLMGFVCGLHRAKMQDIESKRKEKHIFN